MRICRLLASLLLAIVVLCSAAPALAATDPFQQACSAGGSDSAACAPKGDDTITGKGGLLYKVTLIIAVVAGVASVIIMIVAGIMYITSNGDPSRAASAKNAIIYAAIGLAVVATAQGIVVFVVSRF